MASSSFDANFFASGIILIVWHRAGPDFSHEKGFFQLKNFRSLQRENFTGNPADSTGTDGEHTDEFSLIVPRHMPGDGWNVQSQNFHHPRLDLKALFRMRGQRAYGAAHFADKHPVFDFLQPLNIPAELICPDRRFISESDRQSVDDVRAAAHNGILVFFDQFQRGFLTGFHLF